MAAYIYDRVLLILTLIVVTPLLILSLLSIVIGYPLHLIKESIVGRLKR
ncbi:MAG: hypothetical protein WC592_04100 [Candidatus Omnitrophota bacterium]|nr:hypothetical protein [Candidatus Omnitrophota bacterium]